LNAPDFGEFFFQNPQVRRTSLVVLLPGKGENVSTKKSAEVLADAGFSVLRFRSGIALFDKKKFAAYEALTENDVRTFAREGARIIEQRACDYYTVINHFDQRFSYRAVGISGVSLGGVLFYFISLYSQAFKVYSGTSALKGKM